MGSDDDWRALTAAVPQAPADPRALDRLPEPARRWLALAVDPGAPPSASVELAMHGEIFLGKWRRFRAPQVIAPGLGFVWTAVVGSLPMRITGHDRYAHGAGDMHWRLLGAITVMSAGSSRSRSRGGAIPTATASARASSGWPATRSAASASTRSRPGCAPGGAMATAGPGRSSFAPRSTPRPSADLGG